MQAAINQRTCIHCGNPFQATEHRPDFCCGGCQFVHDLITRNGFGQFYDLQEGVVPPAQSLVFQKRDYTWLEKLEAGAAGSLTLDVQGLSCIGCAWLMEKLFLRRLGALAIHVDPTLGRLTLRWQPGTFSIVAFAEELQSFGYLVGPLGACPPPSDRPLNLRLGLCAALAMNTMLFTLPHYLGMGAEFEFAALFQRLNFLLGTLSFLIGGSYFFIRSWQALRQRVLHIDLPISFGLLAAYGGSVIAWTRNDLSFLYFDFVSTFTFLMLAGRWLQQKAVARNRHQLLAAQLEPPTVRLPAGERIPATQLEPGTYYAVEPGQIIPVQSVLHSPAATLGMEWINGESEPLLAREGRLVPGGSTNCGSTALDLEARESWSGSLLARLLQITPATGSRDGALERFLRIYIAAALVAAALGFCGWWVATGLFYPALQVAISVLVVSCPCASGVALPLCRDLAATRLRQFGVFVRDADVWRKIDRVRKILFDKTGTLTLESMSLLNPSTLQCLSPEERSVLLAMVRHTRHPVGGCIREQLLAESTPQIATPYPAREIIGYGMEMNHEGSIWRLGRARWAAPGAFAPGSDCLLSKDDRPIASFRFGETPRTDARAELAALRRRGCEIFILSGDRRTKVNAMADRLELPPENCYGELSPDAKGARVEELDSQDTLYLGDGANDSLAVDAAWLAGTPAIDRGLLERKAGFYFLGRGLRGVRALLEVAAQRRRTARAVVAFAIAYNAVAIALCLAGRMNPLLAAILMPASSLVSLGIVFAGFSHRSPKTS